MKKYIIAALLLGSCWLQAQNSSNIPPELLENAFSVVVSNDIEYVCESNRSGVKKESITITILSDKGRREADFMVQCDKFNSLRKFSGEVFDRTGKSIRKIKRTDLLMTEYSSGLFTDDYRYFYECSAPSYPFTVKYEWEIKCKDGILSFPVFVPQDNFNQSVVKATYTLHTPADLVPRYKAVLTDITPEKTQTANGNCLKVAFKHLKAIESEPYSPSIVQLIPYFYFNPTDFHYDGTQGSMESWQIYGMWQNKLLQGRDALPPAFKNELKEMTAACTTDREKVKVLYDYLASTTRYVSIQLGIGGFQPAPATDVNKTGFGDCKGLSNYMMAMLKEVGVKSYYAEISTIIRRMFNDYVSLNQTNHAILQVPLEGDTLWLECTNAQLPFGYVHKTIAGHDALAIKETGGEICQLPTYPDSLNIQNTVAYITLDADGKARIDTRQTSHLFQYEEVSRALQADPGKHKDYLRSGIQLAQASIDDLRINEVKEAKPYIDIQYKINSDRFGNRTGNRLFIPANIFRNGFINPGRKKRVHDIHIGYGYLDTDSITIRIPDGYTIESAPKTMQVESEFGSFRITVENEGQELKIAYRLLFKSGKYSKEKYDEFVVFCGLITGQYDGKIILRKE